MTEEAVRAIFIKNVPADLSERVALNNALMASAEEIFMTLVGEQTVPGEVIPEIVRTVISGGRRIGLFMAILVSGEREVNVPSEYLAHLDYVHQAMLDATKYALENYDSMSDYFTERFKKEDLEMISESVAEVIKRFKASGNTRGIRSGELDVEMQYFSSILGGILGIERLQKIGEEYNETLVILRQCQTECKLLRNMPPTKSS